MHYIVCGMGHVGYRAVRLLLSLGATVSVITTRPQSEWCEVVRARGVEVLEGDGRNLRLLHQAGLDRADAVLALTNHDLINIEIALDAKRVRSDLPVVVRLFDQSLARQVEGAFDLRRVLAMSAIAAPSFVAAVVGERIVSSFRFGEQLFVVGRITAESLRGNDAASIWSGSRLLPLARLAPAGLEFAPESVGVDDELMVFGTGQAWEQATPNITVAHRSATRGFFRALSHPHPREWLAVLGAMWSHSPLAIRSLLLSFFLFIAGSVLVFHYFMKLPLVDALYFVSTTVTTVGYGDISPSKAHPALKLLSVALMLIGPASLAVLYSIITDFIVTARLEQLAGARDVLRRGHVVVIGLGNVGYRIVEELRNADLSVVVVERDGGNDFVESIRSEVTMVIGDARTRETLEKAGVRGAAAVVAATDDDIVNLAAALTVKEINPKVRTVVRFFDGEFARKIEGRLHVDVALSAAEIAAPHFVAAALDAKARAGFSAGDFFVVIAAETADERGAVPSRQGAQTIPLLHKRGPDPYQRFGQNACHPGDELLVAYVRRVLTESAEC